MYVAANDLKRNNSVYNNSYSGFYAGTNEFNYMPNGALSTSYANYDANWSGPINGSDIVDKSTNVWVINNFHR